MPMNLIPLSPVNQFQAAHLAWNIARSTLERYSSHMCKWEDASVQERTEYLNTIYRFTKDPDLSVEDAHSQISAGVLSLGYSRGQLDFSARTHPHACTWDLLDPISVTKLIAAQHIVRCLTDSAKYFEEEKLRATHPRTDQATN